MTRESNSAAATSNHSDSLCRLVVFISSRPGRPSLSRFNAPLDLIQYRHNLEPAVRRLGIRTIRHPRDEFPCPISLVRDPRILRIDGRVLAVASLEIHELRLFECLQQTSEFFGGKLHIAHGPRDAEAISQAHPTGLTNREQGDVCADSAGREVSVLDDDVVPRSRRLRCFFSFAADVFEWRDQ